MPIRVAVIDAGRIVYGGSVEYNDTPLAFTARIRGACESGIPNADGFLSVTVSTAGVVKITGNLSDDTAVTASGPIVGHDLFPLYLSLYKGKGSLSSELEISDCSSDSDIRWVKSAVPTDKAFKDGFDIDTELELNSYHYSKGRSILYLGESQGLADFVAYGGNIGSVTTSGASVSGVSEINDELLEVFRLMENNTIAQAMNPDLVLTLKFVPATGFFTGSFKAANAGKSVKATTFKGAVFQDDNSASGFFLAPVGVNAVITSGSVEIGAHDFNENY